MSVMCSRGTKGCIQNHDKQEAEYFHVENERLKRELRERNQFLRDANRGAELNAKVNRLLVDEAAELRAEKEQLRELLSRAAPWVQTCGNLVLVEEIRKALRRESNDE